MVLVNTLERNSTNNMNSYLMYNKEVNIQKRGSINEREFQGKLSNYQLIVEDEQSMLDALVRIYDSTK